MEVMTATKPEERKYWRESDARAFVEEHAASGLTIAAFARGRGIAAQRLKRWRKRFGIRSEIACHREETGPSSAGPEIASRGEKAETAGAGPAVVRIVRVERATPSVVSSPTGGAVLTIDIGRARVAVPAGFDGDTVRAVLEALVHASRGGAK
jgi:hypothetical protein